MDVQMKEKITIGSWSAIGGAIGGAIILAIIGFNWGGWVTGDTAQKMVEDAVLDRLAPICVAQFQQDPNREERLKELKKLDSYGINNRSGYVKKQGWATMPGDKSPDNKVADECVGRIMEFAK